MIIIIFLGLARFKRTHIDYEMNRLVLTVRKINVLNYLAYVVCIRFSSFWERLRVLPVLQTTHGWKVKDWSVYYMLCYDQQFDF